MQFRGVHGKDGTRMCERPVSQWLDSVNQELPLYFRSAADCSLLLNGLTKYLTHALF
jgi:hypothetical protein